YCILYTVYCILYTVYCILYTVYCILYTVYCILAHCTLHTASASLVGCIITVGQAHISSVTHQLPLVTIPILSFNPSSLYHYLYKTQ
ncbi:hypothetical protein B484DRAFT_341925, partial [Ochromonadaceae sp. CCMP2298]